MEESINPANGHVRLVATDLYLPGRNGMDLRINRIYNSSVWQDPGCIIRGNPSYNFCFDSEHNRRIGELKHPGAVGLGWDIVMGEIQLYSLCSIYYEGACPTGFLNFDDMSWIMLDDGVRLEIASSVQESDIFLVKNMPSWKLELFDSLNRFVLTKSDGTVYTFGKRYVVQGLDSTTPDDRWARLERFWLTRIEDTNGNFIDICYYDEFETPPIECGIDQWSEGPPLNQRIIAKIIDNLGREIIFNVEKHEDGQFHRIYVNGFTYTNIGGNLTEVKYFLDWRDGEDELITYGFFRDPLYNNYVTNGWVTLLDSVAYFHHDQQVQVAPATRFQYDLYFGFLTDIVYPNGGNVQYEFARILFNEYTGYNSSSYGYARIINKKVNTAGMGPGEFEEWNYTYADDDGNFDDPVSDGDFLYNHHDPYGGSSVGNFFDHYDHYLPNYCITKIEAPDHNYKIYHYFDENDPHESPPQNDPLAMTALVGTLDSVETYSSGHVKLSVAKTYYDHQYSIGKYYFDEFNNIVRKAVPTRLIGELTLDEGTSGPAMYFTKFYDFEAYERPRCVVDYGEVDDVTLIGQYPVTNGFNVTDQTPADRRGDSYRYYYENDENYDTFHMIDRLWYHAIVNSGNYILKMVVFAYDEAGHNLGDWHPADGGSPVYWVDPQTNYRGNLTSQEIVENEQDATIYEYYYDPAGNVVKKMASHGDTYFERETTYEYKKNVERAYLTKYTIDPQGLNLYKTYSYWFPLGLPQDFKDYNENPTFFAWDVLGRISYVNIGGVPHEYEFEYIYDAENPNEFFRVIRESIIDGDYKIDKYFVDALNRIAQHQEIGTSNVIVQSNRYLYDHILNTSIKPILKNRTQGDPYCDPDDETGLDSITYHFDAMGRTTETDYSYVDWPERHYTQNGYDANEIIYKDEDENETKIVLGARNTKREIRWGQNFNTITEFTYDAVDRLIRVENAIGQVDTFIYDMRDNLIASRITDHSDSSTFIYSPEGLLMFAQDPNRQNDQDQGWVYYMYDAADRLIEEGLLNIPPDCDLGPPPTYDHQHVLCVDPAVDPEDEVTMEDVISLHYMVDFASGCTPCIPPLGGGEEDGPNPELLRTKNFTIIEVQTGRLMVLKVRDGSGYVEDIEPGFDYVATLYDDQTDDGSCALLSWTSQGKPPPECPSYDLSRTWTKVFYYDSYDLGTVPPEGLNNPKGNMTKMKSRPADEAPWDYTIFFYDERSRLGEKWVELIGLTESKKFYYEYNDGDLITSIECPNGDIVSYEYDDFARLSNVGDGIDEDYYATLTFTPTQKIETMILDQPSNPAQTLNYEYNAQRDWLTAINSAGVSPYDDDNGDHYSEILTYL